MKKLLTVMAVAVSLALTSGVALASSCPKVIKEGREAAAKMDKNDPKVKGAVAKLDEAQGLHDGGKHAESLAKADRKSTRLNSSHSQISYAVFCLKKKNTGITWQLVVSQIHD